MEEAEQAFVKLSENEDHDKIILIKNDANIKLANMFPDVHHLIKVACGKLNLMEKLNIEETVLSESNSSREDLFEDNHGLKSVQKNPPNHPSENILRSNKSFLHYVLIKHGGAYHCSECFFYSKNYKSFHHHCAKVHAAGRKPFISDISSKVMYHCSKCLFATFNVSGFKTHCATRHKKFEYQKLLNCIPLSNPEAYSKFELFVGSLRDSKQRKHALRQSEQFFERHSKPQKIFGSKARKRSPYGPLVLRGVAENITCMMCAYATLYPNEIKVHYRSVHGAEGPLRDTTNHLYRCESCSFSNISYKVLHRHFKEHHELLLKFTHKYLQNDDISAKGEEENQIQDISDNIESPNCKMPNQSNHADGAEWMKCDRCSYKTTQTHQLLDHWRAIHNRVYPHFVMKHIYERFGKNLIEVDFPSWMIDATWMNGWVNQSCTHLIQKPLYKCGHCEYTSLFLATLKTHFGVVHPQASHSLADVEVLDADMKTSKYTHRLCKKNILYQCCICQEFASCFFKEMFLHLTSRHENEVKSLNETELDDAIRNSFVTYCVKCQVNFPDCVQALSHYQSEHFESLTSFRIKSSSDSNSELYQCGFCDAVYTTLIKLSQHLETHRFQQLDEFTKQHIPGYCCSMCRRVFRAERLYRHHFSRLHIEWTESSFKYSDFPSNFFCERKQLPQKMIFPVSVADQKSSVETVNRDFSSVSCSSPEKESSQSSTPGSSSVKANNAEVCEALSDNCEEVSLSGEYSCCNCAFSAKSVSVMCVHYKRTHGRYISIKKIKEMKVEKDSATTENNFLIKRRLYHTCSHRRFMGKNPTVYQKHIDLCHNTKQPNNCPLCSHAYVCEVVLRMHMRKKHKSARIVRPRLKQKDKIMTLTCTHRNIEMRSPRNYRLHVKEKHSTAEPHHCSECPKVYPCSTMFTNHMRRRHGIKASGDTLKGYQKPYREESEKSNPEVFKYASKPTTKNSCKQNGKDYSHAKSVKTLPGQWRCLYCNLPSASYTCLKRHVMKFHPTRLLVRCRWCDFTSRTKVGLSNHSKVHNDFIRGRMKVLRQIFTDKRLNGVQRSFTNAAGHPRSAPDLSARSEGPATPTAPDVEETSQNVEMAEPLEASLSPPRSQRARKSIQPCSRSTECHKRPKLDDDATNIDHAFKLTNQGTVQCRLCDFATMDRSRILAHLKATHAQGRFYKCKLCFYENESFDEMTEHLNDHHKMKRNHHLVVEMSVKYGPDAGSDATSNQNYDGRLRYRTFVPRPSLPVARPIGFHDNLRDIFDPSMKIQKVVAEDGAVSSQKPASSSARVTRSNSVDKFECRYCDATSLSTFEMERHMKRHEAAMVDATTVDEVAILYSNFTSFLDPR